MNFEDNDLAVSFGTSNGNIPDSVPSLIRRLLYALGVACPSTLSPIWGSAYNIYRHTVIPGSALLALSYFSIGLYYSFSRLRSASVFSMTSIILTLLGLWQWLAWKEQMTRSGCAIQMIQWAAEHGKSWKSVKFLTSLVCWWVLAMTVIDYALMIQLMSSSNEHIGLKPGDKVWWYMCLSSPFMNLWVAFLFLITVWLPAVICSLHRYELRCYAFILDHELGNDGESELDPIPELNELEALVTSRLRMASNTWVRRHMVSVIIGCAVFIALTIASISGEVFPFVIFVMVVIGGSMCVQVRMLASVAETFEYDVLLVLNNPVVLRGAQRYIGQQMLPHLGHLNWGFRFCGSVINSRAVSAIALTMFSALVGLFGSSMLSFME